MILSLFAFSQEQIDIRITEVPYREPYAFLRLHFDFAGQQKVKDLTTNTTDLARSQLGLGLGLISAKQTDIQMESRVSFRTVDISNITNATRRHNDFNILLGGRYLPRYPTFSIGKKTPVRLTFSALGGLNMRGASIADQLTYDVLLDVGLFFSQSDNPSGLMFEFQYRPLGSDAIVNFYLTPSWCFSVSWIIGP